MLSLTGIAVTFKGGGMAAVTLDPAWSVPLNTFLVIVVVILQQRSHKKVEKIETKADENSAKIDDNTTVTVATADVARAAAEAAATAARITQEIGGALRHVDPPAVVLQPPSLEPQTSSEVVDQEKLPTPRVTKT